MQTRNSIIVAVFLAVLYIVPVRAAEIQDIMVKPGETLHKIADYYLKDPTRWPELYKYNVIPTSDPDLALPAMSLKVPVLMIKEHLRAAHLEHMLNNVFYRRRNQSDWSDAELKMKLFNEDGIRTRAKSLARIKFATGEPLTIGPNSFVILRPEEKKEEAELIVGQLDAAKTRVITPSTIIDPKIDSSGKVPRYRAKVKKDKSTEVAVFEGIVDVTSMNRTVTVNKGFHTIVLPKSTPSNPMPLPPLPSPDRLIKGDISIGAEEDIDISETLDLPEEGLAVLSGGRDGQRVVSRQEAQNMSTSMNIVGYHLQVSRDKAFKEVIIDEEMKRLRISRTKLKDGEYYWRVAFINDTGVTGDFSSPKTFYVDKKPPDIKIFNPQNGDTIEEGFVKISGKAEPNTSIRVNDKICRVDSKGYFESREMMKVGKNEILVSCSDKSGNETEIKLTVNGLKGEEKKSTGIGKTGIIVPGIVILYVIVQIFVL